MRGALALPSYAVQPAAVAALSGTPPPPALDELVARIAPRPVFLIHAEHGGGGEELNEEFYAAAGEPKELWRVPGAGHVGDYEADPDEYERRVVGLDLAAARQR